MGPRGTRRFVRRLAPTLAAALALLPLPLLGQDDRLAGLFTEAKQLPLVSQSVTVRIDGAEARVELVQVFANEGEAIAQADYRLHLPEEATVSSFGFWHAGRFLAAELKEREEAREAHRAAAGEGRATALLEREGTVHSFSVFPILAGSLQQVETTIHLPVATERGRAHVRLPLDAFLGHATVTSTVVVHVATPEPLEGVGVEGARPLLHGRGSNWARLAFSSDRPVEVWWAEAAPPLLARAEAVALDDGSLAVQVRLALNDAAEWVAPPRPLAVVVDGSFSMRRRAGAVADLVGRILDQARAPVRVLSVAETTQEVGGRDRRELLAQLLGDGAGFRARWEDLERAARDLGCGGGRLACLVVTDPQVESLPASRPAEFETLFLSDADELAHFGEILGEASLLYQPGIEPLAKLHGLADELVLPVVAVTAIEQRGGTFELVSSPRLRVAQGGLLRLFATTRGDHPLALRLAVAGHPLERQVELERIDPASRHGRAIRRGTYQALLATWMASYQKSRDPEERRQIVEVSLREGIPTALTALHVAASGAVDGFLPPTATPAPLLRLLGVILLLLGWPLYRLARGRA